MSDAGLDAATRDAGDASTRPDGSRADASVPLRGNIGIDQLPTRGSVGFLLVNGEFLLLRMPKMHDTSVNHVSADGSRAYGWYRDLPYDTAGARENGFVLDLRTLDFTPLGMAGTRFVVVRGGNDDGKLVGKLALDRGTADAGDDVRRGFVHDLVTGETTTYERSGYTDIGFCDINRHGDIVGFNDFGELGFTFVGGKFQDLTASGAYRLFPFQLNSAGTVVGFWGNDADSWWDNARNPSFVARRGPDGYEASKFELSSFAAVGLAGINDRDQVAGVAFRTAESLPVVFTSDLQGGDLRTYPLPGEFQPFVTGVSDGGIVFGQITILEEPRPCGGHGTLAGGECTCESGYIVDPYDRANCVLADAVCSGHGHYHDLGDCHCDRGFSQAPGDPSKCVPI